MSKMTWKFEIFADQQRRLFSRIFQVLETQLVSVSSFAAEANSAGVWISFVISSEQDKAYRIEALLLRLHDVRSIRVESHPENLRERSGGP
jgi:acetolactate synthase regulatory subunit